MTDGGGEDGGGDGGGSGGGGGPAAARRASSSLEEIRLARADPAPWGFRIMGGRDYSQPLTVTRVLGCSLAEHAGLKVGDVLISVNGTSVRSATHMEAQDAVREAGDTIALGVIRSTMEMPPPLEVDLPLIQPPLAHEPTPLPEAPEAPEAPETPERQDGAEVEGSEQRPDEEAAAQTGDLADQGEGLAGGEDKKEEEEEDEDEDADGEEEDAEDADSEEEEDEEERKARLNKLDGIRPRLARSPGPDDILRMQEKALARMERARERKDRPPTTFLLPPDRPVIRQPRALRPRPPEPPFKKLVQERIRRRKWAEEHPGEEYPFAEEAGRTPTPDSELTTRATMTPTPTFSDGLELDEASEFADQLASLDADDVMSAGGRSSALGAREDAASRASRHTQDGLQEGEGPEPEPEPEEEEPEVLTALSVEETERRLEEVTAQLDALHNLPRSLRPSVEHIKEELQELLARLLEQLEKLRRQEEEARLAAEREAAEAAEQAERERREAEGRAERQRREAAARAEAEAEAARAAAAAKPMFKTDVPDFIHEMTEKLSLERPSFPLTPLPRPIVLPGGRKWRTVADAFNEDFIAETLTSQAEVLLGKALGINFHKYSHKHDNLKSSAVYRMVHGLDDQPPPPIAERPERMKAIDDYYQAAARQSAAPSPASELERVTAVIKPGSGTGPGDQGTLTPQSG